MLRKLFALFALTLPATPIFAATNVSEVILNSHKFHVTTAVIFMIMAGLIFFMIYLERKMRKIEKRIKP